LINSCRSIELIFAKPQACRVKKSCKLLAEKRTSFPLIFSSRINESEWPFINVIKRILFYFLYWHDSVIIRKGNFITMFFYNFLFFLELMIVASQLFRALTFGSFYFILRDDILQYAISRCRMEKRKKTGECCNVQKIYKDIKLHFPLYWNEPSRMGMLHPPIICISLFNMQTSHPVSAE